MRAHKQMRLQQTDRRAWAQHERTSKQQETLADGRRTTVADSNVSPRSILGA